MVGKGLGILYELEELVILENLVLLGNLANLGIVPQIFTNL